MFEQIPLPRRQRIAGRTVAEEDRPVGRHGGVVTEQDRRAGDTGGEVGDGAVVADAQQSSVRIADDQRPVAWIDLHAERSPAGVCDGLGPHGVGIVGVGASGRPTP
jgi:hypothetical protein